MHMARINIYVPDELAEEAKRSGLNVSSGFGVIQVGRRYWLIQAESVGKRFALLGRGIHPHER